MQYPVLMRVVHSASNLRNQFCRLSDGHWRAPDYFIQLAAFNKLHAEVARAIALPTSWIGTMPGCSRLAAASASRRKRFKCASVAQEPRLIILSATVRLRLFCRARNTTP